VRRAGCFAPNPPPLCFSRGPGRGRVEKGSRFGGEPFTPHSEISERDHFHAETRRTRGEVMQGGERQGFAIPSFWPLRWNVGFRVDPEGGFVSAKASWPPFFGPQSGVVGRDACGVAIAGQRSRPLLRCLNKRQARAKAHLHHENSGRRNCPEWRSLKDHLGRDSPRQISEWGALARANAAGGAHRRAGKMP
jgi:hypothetical protein